MKNLFWGRVGGALVGVERDKKFHKNRVGNKMHELFPSIIL